MSGHYEPLPYLPPPDSHGQHIWDPHGPDGNLVDATSTAGQTIGERALSDQPPMHGWVRGPEGMAMPDYMMTAGTPPAAVQAAMANQSQQGAPTPVQLLLLLE